jgi:putative (di)nucleoside polyphosphate hydrolase
MRTRAWRSSASCARRSAPLRFEGDDSEIRLDLDPHPEFDAWRWAELAELPAMAVGFKRAIYDVLARSFARFAVPE